MTPQLEQRLQQIADENAYGAKIQHAMMLAAEAAMEWLPIDTHPKNEMFLACNSADYTYVELLSWQGDGAVWNYGSSNMNEIKHYTHWMPLPQPPKVKP